MKSWVVEPVSSLSWWDICCWRDELWIPWALSPSKSFAGNCSLVIWALVAGLRDFMSDLFLEPWKRSVENEGLSRKEGACLLGCDRCMGKEILYNCCSSGTVDWVIMLSIRPYPGIRSHFSLVELSPNSRVTYCWNLMRNIVYGSEERMRLLCRWWIS